MLSGQGFSQHTTKISLEFGPSVAQNFSCHDRELARGRIVLSRRIVLGRDSVLAQHIRLLSRQGNSMS